MRERRTKPQGEVLCQELNVKQMLEAGVHFGHQTSRWNPKMKPYISTARNGIHIIDLEQTVKMAVAAYKQVADVVSFGGDALFIRHEAPGCCYSPRTGRTRQYVLCEPSLARRYAHELQDDSSRSFDKLHSLYQKRDAGVFSKLPKKEALKPRARYREAREIACGIKNQTKVPGIIKVVDPKRK
jgi:small subunit ribosomal protein S2